MKNKTHVMVDIETLGKREGATIFQISAMSFDITNGEIKDVIDLKLDIETVDDLKVDGDTLKWWLNTDKELLAELLNSGEMSEIEMFGRFWNWLAKQGDPKDVTLWGNGILFDNAKIQQKMNSLGLPYPIYYKNDRDVRTLLALASDASGTTEEAIKESIEDSNEVAHNALDDVKKQIRLVCHCYQLIMMTNKLIKAMEDKREGK